MVTELKNWIKENVESYEEQLTQFVKDGKSEEDLLESRLKVLKILEYFRKNNLTQNLANVRDTKCEIHYNVYSTQAEH